TTDHSLGVHLAGNHRFSSSSAFEIGVATERDEAAGLLVAAGLIAGCAFWNRGSGTVASCPMDFAANHANRNWHPNHRINMVNVFGRMVVTGLTDSCVAISSDSTLPRPTTNGPDTFELVVAGLGLDTIFEPAMLPLSTVAQLLWAGYGVTPHLPTGKRGLTVPSAVANYYLTQRIYLVADTAVFRYHNRLPPGNNLRTSDHRLQLVTGGDRRDSLRSACSRIPAAAPVYIVVCYTDTTTAWAILETGFAAWQYLMQAHALGLGGHICAPLTPVERTAIRNALGLAGSEFPIIVFSAGGIVTAIEESPAQAEPRIDVRPTPGLPVHIEYSLASASPVELVIRDLAGRVVRQWTEPSKQPGRHVTAWHGADNQGKPAPAGVYLGQVTAGGRTARARIVLPR
ncbi:hypothetical protein FJY70_04790, partial [candidate division WOR-3 bacterium]|nr:hypothetical protein [candidate division WOR-3 bacterium]